jgi:methylated-DNA-[protein]-cysteine S-methyltransferase
LECLQWESLKLFQRAVLMALLQTSAGQISHYGELAELAGSPKEQQAVGQALTRNPFPFIVPCHRVLPKTSKAGIGGFAWGTELKRQLLEHENRERSL